MGHWASSRFAKVEGSLGTFVSVYGEEVYVYLKGPATQRSYTSPNPYYKCLLNRKYIVIVYLDLSLGCIYTGGGGGENRRNTGGQQRNM